MTEPKVSERMRVMVREMLKEIRHDSRFNVMDYDSVDHLLSAIAEIEQRAELLYDCGTSSCLCGGLLEPLHGGQHTNGPCQCTPMQLRQAVVVERQRAEKWKEATRALLHFMNSKSPGSTAYRDAELRVADALAALGDEWDEAVR